jgi:hypothetical protein
MYAVSTMSVYYAYFGLLDALPIIESIVTVQDIRLEELS